MKRGKRSMRIPVVTAVVVVFLAVSHSISVPVAKSLNAAPPGCWNDDGPGCACFVDTGAWLPIGLTISEIATSTLGTIVATIDADGDGTEEGGKPYYQMCLGANSRIAAQNMAWTIEMFGASHREAWCSETISYWHREAGIPFAGGLRNVTWHLTWQCTNAYALQTFYRVQEEITGGRGRWIDWWELDYQDFRPGVNAPVPGAYVKIQKCEIGEDGEPDWKSCGDTCHSMMIDTMTVYRRPSGEVVRIEVEFIEGNAGSDHVVRNTRDVDDLLSVTPYGDEGFPGGRRIVGFGIDLDSGGSPIYGRPITYITSSAPLVGPPDPDASSRGRWRLVAQDPLVRELADYARMLHLQGGIEIWCSHPRVGGTSALPDGRRVRWTFPADLPGMVTIAIDLKQEHPLAIRGVYLKWSDEGVPDWMRVYWADAGAQKQRAAVPRLHATAGGVAISWHPDLPVPVLFQDSGTDVQYLMIELPTGKALTLEELGFVYAWPGGSDAVENLLVETTPAI